MRDDEQKPHRRPRGGRGELAHDSKAHRFDAYGKCSILRKFWQVHRHPELLFPNRAGGLAAAQRAPSPLDRGGVQNTLRQVAQDCELKKKDHPTQPAPLVCHTSVASWHRYSNRTGVAGSLGRQHHHDLHPCAQGGRRWRGQSIGFSFGWVMTAIETFRHRPQVVDCYPLNQQWRGRLSRRCGVAALRHCGIAALRLALGVIAQQTE